MTTTRRSRSKRASKFSSAGATVPARIVAGSSKADSNSPHIHSCEHVRRVGGVSPTPMDGGAPSTNERTNSSQKKGRGKAKLKDIDEGLLAFEFNDRGQPIGPNSHKYSSLLGVLVRERVPVTLNDWSNMSEDMSDGLWSLIKQRFDVPDYARKEAFSIMRSRWREHKSRLTRNILSSRGNQCSLNLLRPDNVKDGEDWQRFVRSRLSNEFKKTSSKFKEMRAKHTMPHTTSRKGFARLEKEMMSQSNMPDSISRVDVWIKGHMRKDNTPLNDAIGEVVRKIRECPQESQHTTSIRDDAVTRVLGPEHRGQVRGLGFGATLSKVDSQGSQREREKRHASQMREMKLEMDQRLNLFQTEMVQLRSLVSQLSARAPSSSTSDIQPLENVEAQKCELLHWSGTGEVVAIGEVDSTDPTALVDQQLPIGPGCWKVWANHVHNLDIPLYRATPSMFYLKDAKGSTVAWPTNCIRLIGA